MIDLTSLTAAELDEALEIAGPHLGRLRSAVLAELERRSVASAIEAERQAAEVVAAEADPRTIAEREEDLLEAARLEQEEISSDPIARAVL